MEPVARVVRKSAGLNIESVELARVRSRESDGLVRVRELPMDVTDTVAPGRGRSVGTDPLCHTSIQTTDTSDSKPQAFTAEPPVG